MYNNNNDYKNKKSNFETLPVIPNRSQKQSGKDIYYTSTVKNWRECADEEICESLKRT